MGFQTGGPGTALGHLICIWGTLAWGVPISIKISEVKGLRDPVCKPTGESVIYMCTVAQTLTLHTDVDCRRLQGNDVRRWGRKKRSDLKVESKKVWNSLVTH